MIEFEIASLSNKIYALTAYSSFVAHQVLKAHVMIRGTWRDMTPFYGFRKHTKVVFGPFYKNYQKDLLCKPYFLSSILLSRVQYVLHLVFMCHTKGFENQVYFNAQIRQLI